MTSSRETIEEEAERVSGVRPKHPRGPFAQRINDLEADAEWLKQQLGKGQDPSS